MYGNLLVKICAVSSSLIKALVAAIFSPIKNSKVNLLPMVLVLVLLFLKLCRIVKLKRGCWNFGLLPE